LGLIVQYVPLAAPYQPAPLQPGSNGSPSVPSYEVEPIVAFGRPRREPRLDRGAAPVGAPAPGPPAPAGEPIPGPGPDPVPLPLAVPDAGPERGPVRVLRFRKASRVALARSASALHGRLAGGGSGGR